MRHWPCIEPQTVHWQEHKRVDLRKDPKAFQVPPFQQLLGHSENCNMGWQHQQQSLPNWAIQADKCRMALSAHLWQEILS